ncbi:MAG: hypothetical protein AB7K71_05470 [Polyangiaceae bacterium]
MKAPQLILLFALLYGAVGCNALLGGAASGDDQPSGGAAGAAGGATAGAGGSGGAAGAGAAAGNGAAAGAGATTASTGGAAGAGAAAGSAGAAGTAGTGATSDSPRLLFSDLRQGPKQGGENGNGAFVTLYGLNLKNTGSVTLGGVALPVISWEPESGPRHLDRIVVQLIPTLQDGPADMLVSTAGGESAPLSFRVTSDSIWFVDPNAPAGGSGSVDSPFSSLGELRSHIARGDVAYLRSGRFTERESDCAADYKEPVECQVAIDSDWPAATQNSRVALAAYPGETPTFQLAGSEGHEEAGQAVVLSGRPYYSLVGLRFEDTSRGIQLYRSPQTDIVGCRFVRQLNQAVVQHVSSDGLRVFGNYVTPDPDPLAKPAELFRSEALGSFEIAFNELDQAWTVTANLEFSAGGSFHHNLVVRPRFGIELRGCAWSSCPATRFEAYSNLIVEPAYYGNLPREPTGAAKARIFNNTVLQPANASFVRLASAPLPAVGAEDIAFVNNLLVSTTLVPHTCREDLESCTSSDIALSARNNWWVGQVAPSLDPNPVSGTPSFLDPPFDYGLMPGPGCGSGESLSTIGATAAMTTDYLARPLPASLDIGAFRCE